MITKGLLETAVRDTAERPIALTLYRSTRRTTRSDGEIGGQLLGPLTFRFWMRPLKGTPDLANMCYLGQQISAGMRMSQWVTDDVDLCRDPGMAIEPVGSMLSVGGSAVLTSARIRRKGLELWLYNPKIEMAVPTIRLADSLAVGISSAQPVSLEGEPALDAIPVVEGVAELSLSPKKIQIVL